MVRFRDEQAAIRTVQLQSVASGSLTTDTVIQDRDCAAHLPTPNNNMSQARDFIDLFPSLISSPDVDCETRASCSFPDPRHRSPLMTSLGPHPCKPHSCCSLWW